MSTPSQIHIEEIQPPENFSMVENGIYRSAFPRTKNFSFLKRLNLKSVIPLVPEEIPEALVEFYNSHGIKLLCHGLDGNKWPYKELNTHDINCILKDMLCIENQPLLIHCNKGKHRTGSVIGCLRKVRGWALTSIIHEYYMFAAPKARLEDQRFIEFFDVDEYKTYITTTTTATTMQSTSTTSTIHTSNSSNTTGTYDTKSKNHTTSSTTTTDVIESNNDSNNDNYSNISLSTTVERGKHAIETTHNTHNVHIQDHQEDIS